MDRSQTLDELLVIQCQQGDRKALALLVKRWSPKIQRHAMRLTQEHSVAQDITQETWISVVKGIGKLRDPAAFKVWIYRIASNKCASWIRSRQQQRRVVAEQQKNNPGAYPPEPGNEKVTRMKGILNELPANQRVVLTLFYLEEHSMREISQILGLPVGTIKSRLYHAREKLKQRYHEKYEKTRDR